MARARVDVDRRDLKNLADRSPVLDAMLREHAQEIMNKAKAVFRSRQIASNEWRRSETTPPKYLQSFHIERIRDINGFSWIVVNDDPAAAWVEWGAHAGGRTAVLGYRPLRTALLAQALSQ